MSVVTIQEHGKTSTGKPKLKASGNWYFLARDIGYLPPVGASVEVREGSFNFPDGKPAKTIEAWRYPDGAKPTAGPTPQPGYIDEASMRFISNVVGSGIAAGTIKEPGQIAAWFTAAKAALDGKPAPEPLSDRIPF